MDTMMRDHCVLGPVASCCPLIASCRRVNRLSIKCTATLPRRPANISTGQVFLFGNWFNDYTLKISDLT